MFFIRADGNEQIGMGHIMRCLTIAEALKKQGEEVCFLLADEKPSQIIRERGFETKILFTYYDEMDVELPQLVLLLGMGFSTDKKPGILVDSYYVTTFYLENLRLYAKVFLMDDMGKDIYPCDGLINYNIYGQKLGYAEKYPSGTELFLGCKYMPLRQAFMNRDYTVRDSVRDIMLTTGGGDSCHMALAVAKRLTAQNRGFLNDSPIWHIVCGPYQEDTEELQNLAKENSFLQIHTGLTDLSDLMLQCDLAVAAAGSTIYELCALGVPTIGYYFVENQRQNMEAFGELTPVLNAGDFSRDSEYVLQFIEKAIGVYAESKEMRERISDVMRDIVDGKGAERLAKALLN